MRVEGTVFGVADIDGASDVWEGLSKREPAWSKESNTVLAGLFRTDAQPAVCELIDLARTLAIVRSALTEKSVPVFDRKVHELFVEVDRTQFDERVTEFVVAALLSPGVSPIAFDPYVPAIVGGDTPRSTDFAVRLPDGDVAIEATVLHVDQFDAWSRATKQLAEGVQARIAEAGAFVALELELPFEFDRKAAQVLLQRRTLALILGASEGELRVPVGPHGDAVVRWRPLSVLTGEQFDPSELSGGDFAAVHSPIEGGIGSGGAISYQPTGTAEAVERLVYRSLENTLQRKRRQAERVSDSYVLALRSGHYRVPPQALLDLLERRVWPNERYKWLTAGVVLFPRVTYNAGDPEARLVTSVNETAAVKASASLRALLSGERGFHLYKGEFLETLTAVRQARAGTQTGSEGE